MLYNFIGASYKYCIGRCIIRFTRILFVLIFSLVSLIGCGQSSNNVSGGLSAVYPTFTPIPTITRPADALIANAIPIATIPVIPVLTAQPTVTPSPTEVVIATMTPASTECPATRPLKPFYEDGTLGQAPWPIRTFQPSGTNQYPPTHFWLDYPVASGGLRVNSEYSYGSDGGGQYLLHNGIDMFETQGTELLAVADGTVVLARHDRTEQFGWRCDWYGQLVVIELDQQWEGQPVYVLYGHILNMAVEEGQRVKSGDKVAEVGLGGVAIRPHLHMEVRVGANNFNSTENALLWFKPSGRNGVIAGRITNPQGRAWQGIEVNAYGKTANTTSHTTITYLDHPTLPLKIDPNYGENFVIHDVFPGEYEIVVTVGGTSYAQRVFVSTGEVALADIKTTN